MVVRKGKMSQLTFAEQEEVEVKWIKLLEKGEIDNNSLYGFWNERGKEFFPRLHKLAMNRKAKVRFE